MATTEVKYFKEYREKLGFTNQNGVRIFFGAKDISPTIDYAYIELLNKRLTEIVYKINCLVAPEIKVQHLNDFCAENIDWVFQRLKEHAIISRLNNQGRRPEEVYFSWMRGFVISNYFLSALSQIFEINIEDIDAIWDDDLLNIETFKRTPKADLQINLQTGKKIRIEMQSGFQGINDIKQHKVLEAKKIKRDENTDSLVIHFDLYNGQVAFVKIDDLEDESVNWITRQQMEGQTVFNIDQNYFVWKLTETPPKFASLTFL